MHWQESGLHELVDMMPQAKATCFAVHIWKRTQKELYYGY